MTTIKSVVDCVVQVPPGKYNLTELGDHGLRRQYCSSKESSPKSEGAALGI